MKVKNDISGLVVLDKEKNMTSNDCLMKLKKILHIDKIGHVGSLDPNATGVLVCLLGNATKSQEYLMQTGDKVYEAEIIFGISTDTEDLTGKITDICNSEEFCDKIDIENKINELSKQFVNSSKKFIGEYNQVPPMFSAKKVKGKKLVDLARKGKIIDRKPNVVKINEITLKGINFVSKDIPYKNSNLFVGNFTVSCSKGTYIRTLCKDIGADMGVPSCMGELRRNRVFDFDIKDSIKLNEIEEKVKNNDYSFIKPCYYRKDESVVTFGKFETLHLGHLKIIKNVVNIARCKKYKSVVVVVGENADNDILTKEQRISKFKFLGIDDIINIKLDDINKKISPEDFVKEILIKQMKAKVIVVGNDCSFGYKGKGDAKLLIEICDENKIDVEIIDKLKVEGTNDDISSTLVKSEYDKGNVEFVKKLLGRK